MDLANCEVTEMSHESENQNRTMKRVLHKINSALARQTETPQQRMQRLELQRLRAAKSRNCETEEQRLKRLRANRERIARIRQNETEEQRESRLKKQRERIRELRKVGKDSERKRTRQLQQQILSENREIITAELKNQIKEVCTMQKTLKRQRQRIEILVSNTLNPEKSDSVSEVHKCQGDLLEKPDTLSNEDLELSSMSPDSSPMTRVCIFTVCRQCGADTCDENVQAATCKNCTTETSPVDSSYTQKPTTLIEFCDIKDEPYSEVHAQG